LLVVVVLLALVAAACGDDDDDDAGGETPETGDVGGTDDSVATDESVVTDDATTTAPDDTTADTEAPASDEPVPGGEVTILQYNEVATLDPHVLTTSGGAGGQRLFPFYGALVTYVHETQEVRPLLAASLESNDDFTVWTLTVRDGVTFSDGTPFTAEAVKVNWERIANPETRSPGITTALSVTSMTVVDDVTLEITLAGPNANFDKAVSNSNLNFVISPQALADGVDLNAETAGAGPYVLEEWRRDDRMTMVRNETYFDAPRPYIDRIEYRVVVDDGQRVDTFGTDDTVDAAWFFNTVQLGEAAGERDGAEIVAIQVPNSPVLAMNNAAAPFDDPRVRRAVMLGMDREAFADVTVGEEAEGATNIVPEDSPWYSPMGDLPDYDPEAAQALFDEVAAETGAPVSFSISGFQNNEEITQYVQTTLNQFDNVEVEHVSNDSATGVGLVIQGDYQMSSWGFPFLDPAALYRFAESTQFTNFAKYANPEVDALLAESLRTQDFDERYAIYEQVFAHLIEDAAWLPYYHLTCGFSVAENLHDVEIFEEATLRVDLMWVEQ
jgi:peptide/nickel transport system substrate-binding protein